MNTAINEELMKIPFLPRLRAVEGVSVEERFESFHKANPHVYEALVALASSLKGQGRKTFGMKALFEFLRFSYALQTSGDSYKINNSYAPFYARLIMQNEPQLTGFFNLRSRWGRH